MVPLVKSLERKKTLGVNLFSTTSPVLAFTNIVVIVIPLFFSNSSNKFGLTLSVEKFTVRPLPSSAFSK